MTRGSRIVLPVPDLGDALVRLRPWRESDADALVAAWHDQGVVATSVPPADRSPRSAVRWIAGWEERRVSGLALDLVVADPVDDHVLGEVGLARFDSARRAALVGWWVLDAERGRGVASRAVGRLVHWVLAVDRLDAVVAEIGHGNDASMAVALACGFRELRPATEDEPAVLARRREVS